MTKKRFSRILGKITIAMVSFFIVSLALELVVRFNQKDIPRRDNEYEKYYKYDKLLGWAGIPFKQGGFQTEGSLTHIRLNSRGFRDRKHDERTREGKKRVLLLGDSFTWGYGVEFDEIFFDRIQEKDPSYEFINIAHCGYGIDQEYLLLDSEGGGYKPDAVLLMFVLNDFAYITQNSAHGHQKPYFDIKDNMPELKNVPVPRNANVAAEKPEEKVKFNRKYLYNHSMLFKLFEDARKDFQYRLGIKKAEEFYESSDPRWILGTKIMEEIKLYCDNNGIKLLIAVIPNKLQLYTFYDSGNPQHMIEEFCRERSIPCLNMLPPFRDKFAGDKEELYFDYDPHWNIKGHIFAAKLVEEFLEREL